MPQICQPFSCGHQVATYPWMRAMYTAESTHWQVHAHQPHWKPQNSPSARRVHA